MPRYITFSACMLLLTVANALGAASEWYAPEDGEESQVRLIAPYTSIPEQGEITLGLHFKLEGDWHVYWKNPGDAGLPPRLTLPEDGPIKEATILYPAPKRYVSGGDLQAFGYGKEIVYPVRLQYDASGQEQALLKADLMYLVCDDVCIPRSFEVEVAVPVGGLVKADSDDAKLLGRFMAKVPKPVGQIATLDTDGWFNANTSQLEIEVTGTDKKPADLDLFIEVQEELIIYPPEAVAIENGVLFRSAYEPLEDEAPETLELAWTVTGLGSDDEALSIETRRLVASKQAIDAAAPGAPSTAAVGASGGGKPITILGFIGMLAAGFLGGLILNVMPCVLPVLSLKVFGLIKSAGEDRNAVTLFGVGTTAGIVVSFWALAGAAVLARYGGRAVGWGVQFQEPTFVVFLTIVVLLFCFNLWGMFEITLPYWLTSKVGGGGGQQKHGFASHFTSGLFATLLATPCSAPFLGTAVGFALSQAWWVTFSTFTAIGIGMAFPYLAIAAVPSAMKILPQPGQWMETLRNAMGFFLFAAAVWLMYVLSAQVSAEVLAMIQLLFLALGFLVWLSSHVPSGASKSITVTAVFAVMTGTLYVAGTAQTATASAASVASASGAIPWEKFDEAKIQTLVGDGQPVFVDVTADWCFTCKVNERTVIETTEVAEAFKTQGIVPVKADWTNRDESIGRYLASFGKFGIPFYVLYVPGNEPHVFPELLTKESLLAAVRQAGPLQ